MTDLAAPERLSKIAAMRAAGVDPYPARGVDATPIAELVAAGGKAEAPGPRVGTEVTIAGRVGVLRDFGKLVFAPLADRSGKLQIGLQRDKLASWWEQRKWLDAGDLLGVRGELGFTKKGELTVWAHEVRILSKAVAPPPEKWHGLADQEARYRRRYVDLWANDGVAAVFVQRSKLLSLTRRFLEARGFLEVETPTLHPIAGGATARPFVTHHNALDADLYLRIAPELYLKRLLVGGMERVFEVSRNFRNEGISVRHNPEFTMLELYQAQADYRHMLELTETLFEHLARELTGGSVIEFRGKSYDLKAPFQRLRYADLFQQHVGCDLHDRAAVRAQAAARKLDLGADKSGASESGYWKLMNDVFESAVEHELGGPVFITDYPTPICPLAKQNPADPRFAERFEVYIGGMEIANAFSELNDPAEQHRRFEEQVASLDPEAPGEVDVDYVQALEYGMPPAGGLGIGIDRLCMVLSNQDSIRDVLLFPTLRQHKPETQTAADPALPPQSAAQATP
jgi:lysyl-tRNA synthetase class 2